MKMKTLNLKQGSPEWLEARLNYKCASEAPAVMNESKHMSRNQLLDLKKGWQANPNPKFKEQLFEKGHEHEDQAREILELHECESYPPVVGLLNDEYLASFDGLANVGAVTEVLFPWEHKDWNLTLAENVRNSVLEPHYYWQLEHQMLVADTHAVMFTCSDGTEENRVSMIYKSVPQRRKDLIAAWKQFDKDLESHAIEAKKEAIVANEAKSFPLITFEVKGTEITSNIGDCLIQIKERAEIEMTRKLETDQDFADKDELNKATKEARAKLKAMVQEVQGKFVSYSDFASVAAEIDSVLQKMQSQGEKQVTNAKNAKKKAIEDGGIKAVGDYMAEINKEIDPIHLNMLMSCQLDFKSAMKNKRTIESLQNAVDSLVAEFKIAADKIKDKVVINLNTLREMANEYEFLFMDSAELVKKDNDDLIAVIKTRINDHKEAEAAKLAKMQEEAELKAQAEQAEKERLEREAAEQSELNKRVEIRSSMSEQEERSDMRNPKEVDIANWLLHSVNGLDQQQANYIASSIVCGSVPCVKLI